MPGVVIPNWPLATPGFSCMQSARHQLAVGVTYFFLTGAPGFWIPVLSKIMQNQAWGDWIVWAFAIPPLASLLSPLSIAAHADQQVPAQRVLAAILFLGAVAQYFAFRELQLGLRPQLFLIFFAMGSLLTAPAFGLLNTITLVHLKDRTDRFGLHRVWGTVGWIAAGMTVSGLGIDGSATVGYFCVGWHLLAWLACWFLPDTVPLSRVATGWRQRLGFGAFQLLKRRDLGTIIICGTLFMMPLTAYYMHSSLFLSDLHFQRIAGTMAIGQITEIVTLLCMGFLLARVKIRTLFLAGILFGVIRYGLFAAGALANSQQLVVIGIALHGLCWTLFFELARPYLDRQAPVEFRAQVQGLMSMGSSGLGSICGTIAVAHLRVQTVETGAASWTFYWSLLAVICALCGIGFWNLFRESPALSQSVELGKK